MLPHTHTESTAALAGQGDAVTIPSRLLQLNQTAALWSNSAFLLFTAAKKDCTEETRAWQSHHNIQRWPASCSDKQPGHGSTLCWGIGKFWTCTTTHACQRALRSGNKASGIPSWLVGTCKAWLCNSPGLATPCFFHSSLLPRNGFWWFISCLSSFLREQEPVAIQLALLCAGEHVKSCHGSRIY